MCLLVVCSDLWRMVKWGYRCKYRLGLDWCIHTVEKDDVFSHFEAIKESLWLKYGMNEYS